MKYAILGLVALLTLGACDRAREVLAQYDPDGTFQCMFLDKIRAEASDRGVSVEEFIKAQDVVVCAVPTE